MSVSARVTQVDVDVAVSGGSLVGATLAALLGQQGVRTAIIEPASPSTFDPATDLNGRVLAITRASEQILRKVGAWQLLPSSDYGYLRGMEVWDGGGGGRIQFDSADLCEPALGYIMGSSLLQAGIEAALHKLPSVQWYRPSRLEHMNTTEDRVELGLDDGRPLRARLVVGADGGRSAVRALAGIETDDRDYGQSAITCQVLSERPHDSIARQVFLGTGPLAFLPLAHAQSCSIVWSVESDRARELMALSDEAFRVELTQAFGDSLGYIEAVGSRALFPLQRSHARRYVGHRFALVGDAAHRIHPLAGQGANLGLMDIATLSEVLIEALAGGRDIGRLAVLRRYERWRRGENLAMMLAMDAFKDGFGSSNPALRQIRNFGLSCANRVLPLKRLIMRRAMGLSGDIPAFVASGN